MKRLIYIFLAFSTLILSGCSSLVPLDPPKLTLISIRPLPTSGMAPKFELELKATNPNAADISLKGATYTLSLNGFDLVHGASKDLPLLPGYGEAKFKLNAELSLFQGMKLLGSLYQSSSAEIEYDLKVKLDAGSMWPYIHLSEKGKMNLEMLLSDSKFNRSDRSL